MNRTLLRVWNLPSVHFILLAITETKLQNMNHNNGSQTAESYVIIFDLLITSFQPS